MIAFGEVGRQAIYADPYWNNGDYYDTIRKPDAGLAVARMVGFVERVGMGADIAWPIQMTLGISDGERLHAIRYSSEGRSRTLYHSEDIAALRRLIPPGVASALDGFSDDARMVVSEPLGDELPGAWKEIPESTFLTVDGAGVETRAFVPARV